MAVSKDFVKHIQGISQPITFENAYWRIENLSGDKSNLMVNVEIRESVNASGTIGQLSFSFQPDPFGKNYHEQAYDYLKALPDFELAVDC
ncbi:hypothetical protein AAIA71_26750 [Vibrio harveyi]|uniref:hypothetical protein n=1 Tax=Vibrio harveyi TaxID=669 RepID=UPI0031BB28FD